MPKNQFAIRLGKLGGLARAAKLTPFQRSESARSAVKARWAKIKVSKEELTLDPGVLPAEAVDPVDQPPFVVF
jgi:hypothetical protein